MSGAPHLLQLKACKTVSSGNRALRRNVDLARAAHLSKANPTSFLFGFIKKEQLGKFVFVVTFCLGVRAHVR